MFPEHSFSFSLSNVRENVLNSVETSMVSHEDLVLLAERSGMI